MLLQSGDPKVSDSEIPLPYLGGYHKAGKNDWRGSINLPNRKKIAYRISKAKQEGSSSQLVIDFNGNGKLDDDPVLRAPRPDKEIVQSANINGGERTLRITRKASKNRGWIRVYNLTHFRGEVDWDGTIHDAIIADMDFNGVVNLDMDRLLIDWNHDGTFDSQDRVRTIVLTETILANNCFYRFSYDKDSRTARVKRMANLGTVSVALPEELGPDTPISVYVRVKGKRYTLRDSTVHIPQGTYSKPGIGIRTKGYNSFYVILKPFEVKAGKTLSITIPKPNTIELSVKQHKGQLKVREALAFNPPADSTTPRVVFKPSGNLKPVPTVEVLKDGERLARGRMGYC
jgi:hypothetical protein